MKEFLNKWYERLYFLRPDKRKYRMAMTAIVMLCMIILEFVLFTFSAMVPNIHSGFYYFFRGIYFLLITSRQETNACQGFVFIAVVLCYIPSIVCAIILYFDITAWLLFDKIAASSFFMNKDADLVKLYLRIAHIFVLAVVFLSICSLIIKASGYSYQVYDAYTLIVGFSSDVLKERFLAAIVLVYYGIGFVCCGIFLICLLIFVIYWAVRIFFIALAYVFYAIGSIFRRKK